MKIQRLVELNDAATRLRDYVEEKEHPDGWESEEEWSEIMWDAERLAAYFNHIFVAGTVDTPSD